MPASVTVLRSASSVVPPAGPVSALLAARLERGWSESELFAELRRAAIVQGVDFPASDKNGGRMVRAWESGERPPVARYQRLLSTVYGKSAGELGLPEPRDGREAVIDAERWGRIYSKYHGWMLKRIAYQVGDFPLAEDLTSETFLQVGRSLDKVDPSEDDNLHRWLAMKARWVVTAHYQEQARNRELLVAPAGEDELHMEPVDTDPLSQPEDRAAAHDAMVRLLDVLPDRPLKVVLLRMVEDLTLPQIAERLGEPARAIERCSAEALATLREHLGVTRAARERSAAPVPVMDGWTRQARSAALSEAASGRTFTTHQLTERYGLPQPINSAKWSSILFELKRDGVIRCAGYAQARKGNQVRLWVGMTANTAALAAAA